MKIHIAGMDPSLSSWGFAEGMLDLETGELSDVFLTLVETAPVSKKDVRVNSSDLQRAEELATAALLIARRSKVIFVEVPVGSQASRASVSYGVCIGILASIRAEGIPVIQVTASEVKLSLTGDKEAPKHRMISTAVALYPKTNWPTRKGAIVAKAEHSADAIGAIYAGVKTPIFLNLMRLFKQVNK